MKTFNDLINQCIPEIRELMPWDLEEKLTDPVPPIIVDIREKNEYDTAHIQNSILAPRGILETCCDWDYDETIPELASAREKEIVLVCRSGNRSVMAAFTMQLMGYENVYSLKTGLRGWNDYEQPLVDMDGNEVDIDEAEEFFTTRLREDQKSPS